MIIIILNSKFDQQYDQLANLEIQSAIIQYNTDNS